MVVHVIYVQPKVLSAGPQKCWEPLEGVPSIARLARKLLPDGPVFIVCHDEPAQCIEGAGVLRVDAASRFEALAAFAQTQPGSTMLVFHQDTLFPDARRTARMLALHREQSADATFAVEYPPGMLPEIYSAAAFRKLSDVAVDQAWDLDRVMERGLFRVARFRRDHRANPEDEHLPASLLPQGDAARRAAERSLREGVDFTRALREVDYPLAPPRAAAKASVLFCTLADILGGAEESLFLLAANLQRYSPIAVLPTRGLLAERMEGAGVDVLYPGFDYGRFNPAALSYFERLLASARPDVVHIDSFQIPALMLAARAARIPVVQHVRVLHGRRAPDVFKFADRVIAVSECARLDLLRSGFDPHRVETIWNGLDLSAFVPPESGVRNRSPFTLAMVARLCEVKGQHFVIEAMPALMERIPDIRLLLAGEAYYSDLAYRKRLARLVSDLGLAGRVTFTGFELQPARVYAQAGAVALATDGEAFGRCILEAQAMGVPVIAQDRHGPAEIITHEVDGLLYRPFSHDDFVAKVTALARDPALHAKLSANGLLRAREFSIQRHVNRVEALYDSFRAGTLD